jgi:large subunit ribosomal protein L17
MLRNLASSLILTERDAEFDPNPPKVKGRVVTTLQKAKEVRPLVEKCVTIARKSLEHEEVAEQYATSAERGSPEWRQWRTSEQWREWCDARAPVVSARRRVLQLLGDKEAVTVLFEEIAPRFVDRDGGYTRVLRLAEPRLGDAGTRAILEFVGKHDRVRETSERPAFDDEQGDEAMGDVDDELGQADEPSDDELPEDVSNASDDTDIDEEEDDEQKEKE